MTIEVPLWLQPAVGDPAIRYSALADRGLLDALYGEEGALTVTDLAVSQRAAGANFSVDISAGRAVIQGDTVSDQGKYLVKSTAVENRTVPSPPVSGTRVHRVVARVRDKLHDATFTTYDWVLEVLEDTGTGTPATPASAISRATVSVAAGQVSVTDGDITATPVEALLRQVDTGWQTVTLQGHWVQNAANPLRVRRIANVVTLSGEVQRGPDFSFLAAASFEQFGSVTEQFRPDHTVTEPVNVPAGDIRFMECRVTAAGALLLDLDGDALPVNATVFFNMTWLVD